MEEFDKLYKDLAHFDPHVRQNAVIGLGKYFVDDKARASLSLQNKSKIVAELLTRGEPKETSMEVKGRTVKIFSVIAKFLTENEIEKIFSKIIKYITNEKAEGKDIYVTCMKTIYKEAPGSCCYSIGKVITPVLTEGILRQNIPEITQLCLDSYCDYISTFDYLLIKENNSVITEKDKLLTKVCEYIASKDCTLQANAINFIGTISIILNKKQICSTVEFIIKKLGDSKEHTEKIAYFNTLTSIAKTSSIKHVENIKTIVGLIEHFSSKDFLENDSGDYDEKNDGAESALNLLEMYILKLNDELNDQCNEIALKAVQLLEYDPNYSYDNTNMEGESDCDKYDDYEDYEQVAVMEDSSWKVRRAATHVGHAIIRSGQILEKSNKEIIISKLVEFLKEHDENTKVDIISCLCSYLSSGRVIGSGNQFMRMSSMTTYFIPQIINQLLTTIIKDLNSNNSIMKSHVLQMLPILASVNSTEIIGGFNELKQALDKNSFDKTENTLIFFEFLKQGLCNDQSDNDFTAGIPTFVEYIEKGVSNEYYKVSIEAIKVYYFLIPILAYDVMENKEYIHRVYNDVLPKFKLNNVDQELRIAGINTMGQGISCCGEVLSEQNLKECFEIYLAKTNNDSIRPHIFTILGKIMSDNKDLPLNSSILVFNNLILDLISKGPLHVQFQVLSLLEKIYMNYPNALKTSENEIGSKLFMLLKEDNLLPLLFNVFGEMSNTLNQSSIETILSQTYQIGTTIKASPEQLKSLFVFTKKATGKVNKVAVDKIIKMFDVLLSSANINETLSKFIAILAGETGNDDALINKCLKNLTSEQKSFKNMLTFLGDICLYSRGNHCELIETLDKIIAKESDEEVKNVISVTIGKVGGSDGNAFTKKITNGKANQYTFLSIREALSGLNEKNNITHEKELEALFDWISKQENGNDTKLNALCGECLGLISGHQQQLIPKFFEGFNGNDKAKAAYYHGMKFIFLKKQDLDVEERKNLISMLITGGKEGDVFVKENAFNSLVTAAHYFSDQIKENYGEGMRIFEKEHKVNNDWIEVADFGGGGKIKKDKGLGIRKDLYTVVKSCVENLPTKINVNETIKICITGLSDTDDIYTIVFGTLIKLSQGFPSAFVSFTDDGCDGLKSIFEKSKSKESKLEFAENVKRLFQELKVEHDIEDNPKFVNLKDEVDKIE